jgi:hypothetical protein
MTQEVAIELLEIKSFDVSTPGSGQSTATRVQIQHSGSPQNFSRGGYVGTNVKVKPTSSAFGDVTVRVFADATTLVELAETKFAFTSVNSTLSDLFASPVGFFDGVWITVEGSVGSIDCTVLAYVQATHNNPF